LGSINQPFGSPADLLPMTPLISASVLLEYWTPFKASVAAQVGFGTAKLVFGVNGLANCQCLNT